MWEEEKMKHIWKCRRTSISFYAVSCLTALGFWTNDVSVSISIATIAAALAGANAYEKRGKS